MGPFANDLDILYGNYHTTVIHKFGSTPYTGLKDKLASVIHLAVGCGEPPCTSYNTTDIKDKITGSDLVIVCLGLGKYNGRHRGQSHG